MLVLKTKHGYKCEVPETDEEDIVPKFNINSNYDKAIKYYEENGFVVLKKIFKNVFCNLNSVCGGTFSKVISNNP